MTSDFRYAHRLDIGLPLKEHVNRFEKLMPSIGLQTAWGKICKKKKKTGEIYKQIKSLAFSQFCNLLIN